MNKKSNKLIEYVNSRFIIISILSIVLITSACFYMYRLNKVETGDVYSKNNLEKVAKVIKTYTLEELGDNLTIRDFLSDKIIEGYNGITTIEGRFFVVLSTGGKSSSDIKYKAETSLDGFLHLDYTFDVPDGNFIVRYKLIELSNENVIIGELEDVATFSKEVIYDSIIKQDADKRHSILLKGYGKLGVVDGVKVTEGLYRLKVVSKEKGIVTILKSTKVDKLVISAKVIKTSDKSNIMTIDIDGEILDINQLDLNLEVGKVYDFVLEYTGGAFKASVVTKIN